jgi:hypothetical protein
MIISKPSERPPSTSSLRERSGSITSNDPLTAFLYLLVRDHLPLGIVEKVMKEIGPDDLEMHFTNGWLAMWADDVAVRLQPKIPSDYVRPEKSADEKNKEAVLLFCLGDLRHLYHQMVGEGIKDQIEAGKGLLGPIIEQLEKISNDE